MRHPDRAAFTLVELLIAVALGAVLCLTCAAALRGAAQAVTAADGLALENALLRDGVRSALDDLDTWRSVDDPDDPARQTLRTAGPWPAPFAPLAMPGVALDIDRSTTLGWFDGDPIHADSLDGGDYALLGGIGDADPERAWRHRLISGITDRLGYDALIEYAPADTIFAWRDSAGHPSPEFWKHDASSPGTFCSPNHADPDQPRDLVGVTRGTLFTITTDPGYVAAGVHRRWFGLWDFVPLTDGWRTDDAFKLLGERLAPLPLAPSAWPSSNATTRRFIMGYRRWQTGTVVIASPRTGALLKLFVATTTTTLRGARLQRDPVRGWARAGGATLDG